MVDALCHRRSPLLGPDDFPPVFANAIELESILRNNSIGGLALLTDVNNATMREDLCIKQLGHRSSITHVIRLLRRHSPKWLANHQANTAENYLSGYGGASNTAREIGAPSLLRSPPTFNPSSTPHGASSNHVMFGPTLRTQHWVQGQNAQVGELSPSRSGYNSNHPNILREAPVLPRPDTRPILSPKTPLEELTSGTEPSRTINLNSDPMLEEVMGITGVHEHGNMNVVEDEVQDRKGETTIIDESGRKRRKLTLGPAETAVPTEQAKATAILTPPSEEPSFTEQGDLDPASGLVDDEVPVIADDEPLLTATRPIAKPDESKIADYREPGMKIIDATTGRKRMRPILVSQPAEDLPSDPEQLGGSRTELKSSGALIPQSASMGVNEAGNDDSTRDKTARAAEHTYLGIKAQPIDELFYGATTLGQPICNNVESDRLVSAEDTRNESNKFVNLTEAPIGNGQRLYVHSQIKRFLRSSQPQVLRRKGNKAYVIVPYPDSMARKHHPLSMTVIEESPNGYVATRQNRSKLVHSPSTAVSETKLDKTFFNVPELTMQAGESEPFEPDFLEKWKYQDGDDEVLPLFGESGSEGEYDLETWREMEDEQGKMARPLGRSKSKAMSEEDVVAAIDQAVELIHETWTAQRLPKIERTGWRLWVKCARDGSKRLRINELTANAEHLETRLTSIRNEILEEAWPSEKSVGKQCKIIQPSLYDKYDCQWKLSVLKSKKPPSKPALQPSRPNSFKSQVLEEPLANGEEKIMSEDSAAYTSEDDLDDFVVDDDLATDAGPTEDTMVADPEDENSLGPSDTEPIEEIGKSSPPRHAQESQQQSPLKLAQRLKLLPPRKPQAKAKSDQQPVFVDLTQASSPMESEHPTISDIRTPPLKAQESSGDDTKGTTRKSIAFKRPPVGPEIIDLESDTDEEYLPSSQGLPNVKDFEGIRELSINVLEGRFDRKRLLIWVLCKYRAYQRQSALEMIRSMSMHDMEIHVWKALNTYKRHGWRMRGLEDATSEILMLLAAFFVSWTIPVRLNPKGGIRWDHIGLAIDNKDGFEPFYSFLVECLGRFEQQYESKTASEGSIFNTPTLNHIQQLSQLSPPSQENTPTKQQINIRQLPQIPPRSQDNTPAKKSAKEISQDYDSSIYASSQKKRKYAVQESQEAKELRNQAQQRTQDLDLRKKAMKLRYEKMGINDEDPSTVVVNPGAQEGQPFVYLNRKIGQRIQPHQKDGVQFMWREVTSDPQNLQGCLLAHTMGLGKTMQVITLLVTIAEAAQSSDIKIREQVPERLRKSQTLIICPASLVENWYEEFLMWADPTDNNVGNVRKVTAGMTPPQRLVELKAWRDGGGVLLAGFNIFRDLVGNAGEKMAEETHQEILEALLQTPNLIVADEAHTAKNLKSKLNLAMNRFASHSRIGLTGSPLANNLDEYYALIDWVAPNYLGDHVQFKAHYAEPIQQGFYKDSTRGDYLESRKRLKALIADLEPKVHRADISVLKGKLKPKTEFLIRVPLTTLQTDLYQEYVNWMLGVARAAEPKQATLWAWLGELRLLCNHPKCYKSRLIEKVTEREAQLKNPGDDARPIKKPKKKKRHAADAEDIDSEDETEMLDAAAGDPQVSTTMMERQLAIMDQISRPLGSITQAYKMQMVDQILALAKAANDRTLVFSHSIKTLDYIGRRLEKKNEEYARIDGKVFTSVRQSMTKKFNTGSASVCLISTRAGGQGLNLFGANRVVILDTHFNPIWEEQAIGRAYRLGQEKPVYVYRLTVGGTFEDALLNQSIFKMQLATRVVDKKNPMRYAMRGAKQYLFKPKGLEQTDLDQFMGKDPLVLDRLLDNHKDDQIVRSIELTETFQEEDTVELTAEELKEAQAYHEEAQLRRRDPVAWQARKEARERQVALEHRQKHPQGYPQPLPPGFPQAQAQRFPQGQLPLLQQHAGHFVPANFQEPPSGFLTNGNMVNHGKPNGVINYGDRNFPLTPYASFDEARKTALEAPTLPFEHRSNVSPVLGANTLRRNASESPGKHTEPPQIATRAESEPHANGPAERNQTLPPGPALAESTNQEASDSFLADPGAAVHPAKDPTQIPSPDTSGPRLQHPAQRPSTTTDLDLASSKSGHKRKLSRPTPQTAQTNSEEKLFAEPPVASKLPTPGTGGSKGAMRPRFKTGFRSLNDLFNREIETSRNAHPKS